MTMKKILSQVFSNFFLVFPKIFFLKNLNFLQHFYTFFWNVQKRNKKFTQFGSHSTLKQKKNYLGIWNFRLVCVQTNFSKNYSTVLDSGLQTSTRPHHTVYETTNTQQFSIDSNLINGQLWKKPKLEKFF